MADIRQMAKIGLWTAFWKSVGDFFVNFPLIFRITLPAWGITFGVILMLLCIPMQEPSLWKILSSLILGLIIFVWAFWKYILGQVGISYLAKDIAENKPLQKASEYLKYVDMYRKEYIIFLCLLTVLTLCVGAIIHGLNFLGTTFIHNSMYLAFYNLAVILVTLPACLGLSLGLLVWAYNDKNKYLKSLKEGQILAHKNFLPSILFSAGISLLYWVPAVAIVAVMVIVTALICYPEGVIYEFLGNYNSLVYAAKILFVLLAATTFASLMYQYFLVFGLTRFYFELEKK